MTHKSSFMLFIFSLLTLLFAVFSPQLSHSSESPQVVAAESVLHLISDHNSTQPGQTITIGWHIQLTPHWHVYWRNAGDSGLPPQLDWQLPTGWQITGPLGWPTPQVFEIAGLTNYGYEDSLLLQYTLTIPQDAALGSYNLQAQAGLLMCKDVCIPGEGTLPLRIDVTPKAETKPNIQQSFYAVRAAYAQLWPADLKIEQDTEAFYLTLPIEDAEKVRFFPAQEGMIDDSAVQQLDGNILRVVRDVQPLISMLSGRLQIGEQAFWLPPTTPITKASAIVVNTINSDEAEAVADSSIVPWSFVSVLLVAVLAGLILNLMPCVLPVLLLKLYGLVQKAQASHPWRHGVAFGAGVLTMFGGLGLILALLVHAGTQFGWGFQLQSPLVIAGLILLLVVLALNFFGVFSFGSSATKIADKSIPKQGLVSSFGYGLLVAILATPCTTPFMGGAVAYALVQPPLPALLVFLALGFGLAAPFILLSAFPTLLRWVPKPGPWLTYFKQILGFPLLLTAVWLLWVLARQTDANLIALTLLLATLLAFVCWLFALLNQPQRQSVTRRVGWAILITALVLSGFILQRFVPTTAQVQVMTNTDWQVWSPHAVAMALAEGKTVFINATADWCITCKVNEHLVLKSAPAMTLFAQEDVALFIADWTAYDPQITALLNSYHRAGVPLYVIQHPGQEPQVLPQILSLSIIREALQKGV